MIRVSVVISMFGVAAIAVVLVLVWSAQRKLLYPRPGLPVRDAGSGVPWLEKVWLGPEHEQSTEAWLIVPTESKDRSPAIIFAHGNGELIDHWIEEFEVVRNWGVAVLLVEFPGYGRSAGSPSQSSITAAFVNGYDYLLSRPDVLPGAIVGYGRSLGGGAICQLAARRELSALILESTFSSVRSIAGEMGVPRWLVRDPFDNEAVLETFAGPVLLLHGERDQVIPFRHAEVLHEAAQDSELVVMKCGHNDCPRPWVQIREFLEEHRSHCEKTK